jgi:hypothetical protein
MELVIGVLVAASFGQIHCDWFAFLGIVSFDVGVSGRSICRVLLFLLRIIVLGFISLPWTFTIILRPTSRAFMSEFATRLAFWFAKESAL